MEHTDLTSTDYWDRYWSKVIIPTIVTADTDNTLLKDQLHAIDSVLAPGKDKSILEIGGAPGQYLAYFAKKYGYMAAVLDYSRVGCDVTRRNFSLLGIDVTVYQQDLFAMDGSMPQFDIVYSLGVIEHFAELGQIIEKHLELLKPGGILIIGVPHFVRVFSPLLRRLAPQTMAGHNLQSIDLRTWRSFELKYRLQTLFKGYLGGVQPLFIKSIIDEECDLHGKTATVITASILRILDVYARVRRRMQLYIPWLKRFPACNSPIWSAYAMGIYKKPGMNVSQGI